MEDAPYQRVDATGPPPSYNDVVGEPQLPGSVQPTAPPIEDIAPSPVGPRSTAVVDYPEPDTTPGERLTFQDTSRVQRAVNGYVSYSMAHHLRKYMIPKSDRLDPELDVEAQFSRRVVRDAQSEIARKERLRCLAGWLWCFGVLLVVLYILLPIAMLVVGGVGFSDCSSNSGVVIIYLLLGGSLVAVMVCMRSTPSLMTGCRNRNYFKSKDSVQFLACICLFEIGFYAVAIGNIVILVIGSIWIFRGDTPTFCSSTVTSNCCSSYVYISSGFFNVFQYLLYVVSLLYFCGVFCCIRAVDRGSRK